MLQCCVHQPLAYALTLQAWCNEQHRNVAAFLELDQPRDSAFDKTGQHEVVTLHALGKRLGC
ncbi:hypothetical protein D9M71_464540 [compost metagenome]